MAFLCARISRTRPPPPQLLPSPPHRQQVSLGGVDLPRRRRRSPLLTTTPRSFVTLAIETSCDDTAVAVLEHRDDEHDGHPTTNPSPPRTRLLFNERITSDMRPYRGVLPTATLVGHQRSLAALVAAGLASLSEQSEATATTDGTATTTAAAEQRRRRRRRPDLIAVTRGPGIQANLSTGLATAKGLAVAWDVPLVGVHHMQAHALTPRLVRALKMPMVGDQEYQQQHQQQGQRQKQRRNQTTTAQNDTHSPRFPYLTLLVSGGHSQLVLSAALTDHRVLATTTDSAIGNVLDQTARVILPADVLAASPDVMYGRLLEAYAFPSPSPSPSASSPHPPSSCTAQQDSDDNRDPYAFFQPPRSRGQELRAVDTGYPWHVPLPMRLSRKLSYSFSAIHSSVHAIMASRGGGGSGMGDEERRALARHTQRVAFEHLVSRLCLVLEDGSRPPSSENVSLARRAETLVVAGGVASNKFLMHVVRATLSARGLFRPRLARPPKPVAKQQTKESDSTNDDDDHAAPALREIIAPPPSLCTDNAAMVAWAGLEMFRAGWRTGLDVLPVARWPLDPELKLSERSVAGCGGGGGDGGSRLGLMEIEGWERWKS